MTSDFIGKLTERYHAYVDTFRDASGALPVLMQLKLDHTCRVVEDARRVMAGERWEENACRMGEVCALLHDTARYSQFQAFGTFRDSESFDHAERAVEIIRQQGWLVTLPEDEQRYILTAIQLHNKREAPLSLAGLEADLVHLVRDADKLDIFRVLEEAVNDGSLARNPEIAWGLQMKGAPNPAVVEAVAKGQTVSYDWVRAFSDFVLIQVGWLNGGLHFNTSMRLAVDRDVLGFRETLLKTFTDDHSGILRCCEATRRFLSRV